MLAQFVLVSALGFHAPKLQAQPSTTKLLALRGGMSTDVLVNTAAALNIGAGTSAWLAPKKNLEMYGATDANDVDLFFMRGIAALQIVLGVALVAGKADFNTMAQVFTYGHAVQCLAVFPSFEKLNVPTGAFISTIFLLVAFPELTRLGVLKPSTMSNVAIFFYVAISFAETCTPKPVLEAFGFTEITPLTQFLMGSYSTVKLQGGVFVLVSKLTGNPAFGLLAALAAGGFNCVKAILSADKTGFGKAGPLAWIGVQVVLGLLTYMSASA